MTAKVISLCDYRRSRDEGKRLRRGNVPGLPSKEFCDKRYDGVEEDEILDMLNDIAYDPYFDLDPDDY
jgi:hypothetical protein